jgi:ribosomal protein S18 acetylase RimI-like enzyme
MYLADYDTDLMCHGAYLADLYVDMRARRCGIGRALMAGVARITREHGGQWLRWNVLRSNPSARAFYRTLGREKDHLVMYSVGGDRLAALAAEGAPTGLILRPAAAADAPVLGALVAALRANEGFESGSLDLPARIAADGFGAQPAFICHLAERSGRAVGYAMHWLTYDTEPAARCGYLSDLFVLPAHRRGGVARALMSAVAHHWAARGAPWIEWEVRRENAAARAFYATLAEPYPDVIPMIAAGDQFHALAAEGLAIS